MHLNPQSPIAHIVKCNCYAADYSTPAKGLDWLARAWASAFPTKLGNQPPVSFKYEVAEAENTRPTGLTEDDKRMYATPYLERGIASGRYPHLARYFTEDVRVDAEQSFAFGLEYVLNGLATRILRQ